MAMTQAQWLKKNTFRCKRLSARISKDACKRYSKVSDAICVGCKKAAKQLPQAYRQQDLLYGSSDHYKKYYAGEFEDKVSA